MSSLVQRATNLGRRSALRALKNAMVLIKPISPHGYTALHRKLSGHSKTIDTLVNSNKLVIDQTSQAAQRRLFIDCGVNYGIVLERYMMALPNFDFLGFEIQSELIGMARATCPGADIQHKAVSVSDEDLEIFLPKSYGMNFRGGTSILERKIPQNKLLEKRVCKSVNFGRVLQVKRAEGYDYVAVKMDIEGAEYAIIDMLHAQFKEDGKRLVDYLMIEFHQKVLDAPSDHDLYVDKLREMGIAFTEWI